MVPAFINTAQARGTSWGDAVGMLDQAGIGVGPMANMLYNTQLTPLQYAQYMHDMGRKSTDTQDYDMRGAWLNGARANGNGHFTDQFKKPNHPTFSDQSQYSTPQHPGGYWTDNTFVPSANMYADRDRMQALIEYLKGPAEQGQYLMVPPTIASPNR